MNRIQERDIRILFDLLEHRVLTTGQIAELHFDSYRVASRRAFILHQLGFLARFRPGTSTGSAPWHYALDEPGAFVVASRLDRDLKDIHFRKHDADRLATSEHLLHLVETKPHERLRAKLRRYAGAWTSPRCPRTVLFAFPKDRGEADARRSLGAGGLTVATTALPRAMADPMGDVWQPLRHPFRVGLLRLRQSGTGRPT